MAFPTNSAVLPIPGMAQNELHYMASIRYPIITQPLGMDRVVMLLNKAREAISRMSFHWVILQHPKNGECFLLVRPEDNSFRAPDGYQWKKLPDVSNKVFGNQTLEVARFESAGSPYLLRLEYRLMLPNNRLIFVHYLARESLVMPSSAAKIPALAYPDPRMQMPMARPPIRSPMPPGVAAGPKQVTIRKVSAIPAQNQAPRQAGEDLLDLVNDEPELSSHRIHIRQNLLKRICTLRQEADTFEAEDTEKLISEIETARQELETLQKTVTNIQHHRDKMKAEHDRVLKKMKGFDREATIFTLTKDWAEIAEIKTIRRIRSIVKHK